MNRFVLDVSTAAKWVLPTAQEPLRHEANALLRRYKTGELEFLVPDLFWCELGNVLRKAVRARRLTKSHAEHELRELRLLNLPTAQTPDMTEAALEIAGATDRSFYDSVYVALAAESGAPWVTADERLVNALGSRWPVKWLGAL